MKIITSLILFTIVAIGFVFACLNASPVNINYYLGESQLPLALLLLLALCLGALLGCLVALGNTLRLKKENRGLKRQMKS